MWPRFLRAFANVFVVAYGIEALVSVVHVGARIALGPDAPLVPLTVLRAGVAGLLLLLAMAAVPLLGVTPRLAPSVFVPLAASTLWIGFGALPLPFVASPLELDRGLTVLKVGIACAAFIRIRDLRGGDGWLFSQAWFRGPLFSGRHLATYAIASSTVIVTAVVLLSSASIAMAIQWVTNGFVRFDAQGVSMAERTYVNEDDPAANAADPTRRRRIRLIAMMHVGENDAYRELFRDLDDASRLSIVLMEGVSDDEGLLDEELSYRALADFLGVEEQGSIEDYVESPPSEPGAPPKGATFVNADLDLDDFDPATVAWLRRVGELYTGDTGIEILLSIYRDLRKHPAKAAAIAGDIIDRRNRNLIDWIRASRVNYHEIVVPWGALHLPGIEAAVVEMGFEPRTISYVPLIGWGTLARAIFTPSLPDDDPASDSGAGGSRGTAKR
jgi:hypothetical protein